MKRLSGPDPMPGVVSFLTLSFIMVATRVISIARGQPQQGLGVQIFLFIVLSTFTGTLVHGIIYDETEFLL